MPAKMVRITFMDKCGTYSQRDMPMPSVRKFRQMMEEKGVTLVSSRPIAGKA